MVSLDDLHRLIAMSAERRREARAICERVASARERVHIFVNRVKLSSAERQQERQRAAHPRERDQRRCPRCASTQFEPTGNIRAEKGSLKISGRCGSCAKPYILVKLDAA